MFRNYFVSRAASSGMSFVHVMEATGHDSYERVRYYFDALGLYADYRVGRTQA